MKCEDCGLYHNPLNECICKLPVHMGIKRKDRECKKMRTDKTKEQKRRKP